MNTAALLSQYTQVAQAAQAHLELLTPERLGRLDALLAVEQRAYSHPWSRGNFTDSLHSGYQIELLLGGDQLIGYFVAMPGVEEAHLLNITVAPACQGQGWARVMLDALRIWATGQRADWLWLEVRVNNPRARAVYEAQGYRQVGLRKNYYPAAGGQREDALVMSLKL